jgi:hypothetical protein
VVHAHVAAANVVAFACLSHQGDPYVKALCGGAEATSLVRVDTKSPVFRETYALTPPLIAPCTALYITALHCTTLYYTAFDAAPRRGWFSIVSPSLSFADVTPQVVLRRPAAHLVPYSRCQSADGGGVAVGS